MVFMTSLFCREGAVMQAIGVFTLTMMVLMLLEIEVVSSNPCSQFSESGRQSLCTSDSLPGFEVNENE
jgi:hypothetical protein